MPPSRLRIHAADGAARTARCVMLRARYIALPFALPDAEPQIFFQRVRRARRDEAIAKRAALPALII